jgi:hypothetical protein
LEYLEAGLTKFAATFAEKGITSVSFPRLGSGQGGLDWETEVRPLMEAYLGSLPISIYLHDDPENNRFAPERRNARAIRSWLVGQPQIVTFAKFWRDLTRMIDKHDQFATLDDDSINFRAGQDTGSRRQGRNLVILPPGPQPLFVSESLLVDLWTYIRGAGYILPQNLPGGLDERAPYIIALLAGLDYLRPVHLAVVDSEPVVGLHYVPPVEKEEKSLAVTLKAKG